MVRKHYS